MNDVNQMVAIKLLSAISSANSNYNNSTTSTNNNVLGTFESIFKNTLGSGLYSGDSNNSCTSCNSGSLNSLNTILTSLNNNRVLGDVLGNKNIVGDSQVNNKLPVENNTEGTITSSSKMDKAMELLNEQLGKKYVWGATGPSSFDCSGLTQYIYKTALGKDIPRVSYDQAEYGQAIKKEDLQVGDLVFFDTMNKGRVSHVGIYVGNNEFIHASNPRDGVKKSTLSGFYDKTYLGARRP
ncbi:C40 family peptidase [Romboutsia sp.]|uniref:C40 family peptidase n=1 Tax=Romboutsia sp. TaxID=1965302 RepID=UPI003F3BD5A4